jgi:GT2 family glycosyltransferase
MSQPPRVRLVVLNYNGGDLTARCVRHLERLDWPADRLEIVVVDNASADGSDQLLEQRPRVTLIRSPRNTGFPANNLALRDLDDVDFVGLVNNDAFAEPDFLQPLVDALDSDERIGAACPKIVLAPRFVDLRIASPAEKPPGDGRQLGVRISAVEVDDKDCWRTTVFAEGCFHPEKGTVDEPEFRWCSGRALVRVPVALDAPPTKVRVRVASVRTLKATFDGGAGSVEAEVGPEPVWVDVPLGGEPYDIVNNVGSVLVEGGYGADRGFLQPDEGQFDEPSDVFAWCGAGVLFNVAYLREIGLFDERFFMYYEDTDMAWRGRARGWRYRYVPESKLRHVHSATSVEGSPLFQHHVERNRLVMLTKNASRGLAAGAVLRFLLTTLSYARRDVVMPLLRGRRPSFGLLRARLRSFFAYLRMVPELLSDRRQLRATQTVHDEAISSWAVKP